MAERVSMAAGDSNVTDDVALLHSRTIEKAWEVKKAANAEFLMACKKASDDGVDAKDMIAALKVKKGDPAAADISLRNRIRYRKLLGVPVKWDENGQGGWDLPTQVSPEAQQKQDEFDDFADGEQAGLDGHSATTCKHEAGTENYQTWMLGWEQGQRKNLEGKNKPAAAAAAAAPKAGRGKAKLHTVQ